MREALIGAALVMMALNLVILYAALVLASRCDDMEEEYWRMQMAAYVGRFCGAKRPRCGAEWPPLSYSV